MSCPETTVRPSPPSGGSGRLRKSQVRPSVAVAAPRPLFRQTPAPAQPPAPCPAAGPAQARRTRSRLPNGHGRSRRGARDDAHGDACDDLADHPPPHATRHVPPVPSRRQARASPHRPRGQRPAPKAPASPLPASRPHRSRPSPHQHPRQHSPAHLPQIGRDRGTVQPHPRKTGMRAPTRSRLAPARGSAPPPKPLFSPQQRMGDHHADRTRPRHLR